MRSLGYDIKHIDELGLKGSDDEKVASFSQKEDRIVITFDLDFGEIYYFASTIKVGMLVLRIIPQTVEHANEVLENFLKANVIEAKNLIKSLIILDEKKYRHREKE